MNSNLNLKTKYTELIIN